MKRYMDVAATAIRACGAMVVIFLIIGLFSLTTESTAERKERLFDEALAEQLATPFTPIEQELFDACESYMFLEADVVGSPHADSYDQRWFDIGVKVYHACYITDDEPATEWKILDVAALSAALNGLRTQ